MATLWTKCKRVLPVAAGALLLVALAALLLWPGRCGTSWAAVWASVHRQNGDVRVVRYWLVPRGTTEQSLRRRFGPPDLDVSTTSATYRAWIARLRRNHWTTPPTTPGTRVLNYHGGPTGLLSAFYFLDGQGRVIAVFVGET